MSLDVQPLVSVLMTVYNKDVYLKGAIESVIASTYEHWELILVDDCSNDNSADIARSFSEHDDRITLYSNETNLGDYPNRNRAASYAKGKYLKYVDADDQIYPYGLEILVHYMEQYPEVGYGLCSMVQDKERMYPFAIGPQEAYQRHFFGGRLLFDKASLDSIIRKSVFESVGGFANVRHFGDFELFLRLSKIHQVLLMPQGIVFYRRSDGQEAAIRQKNPINALKTFQAALSHINSEDCPLSKKDQQKVSLWYHKLIASLILYSYRKFNLSKAQELKNAAKVDFNSILKLKFFSKCDIVD